MTITARFSSTCPRCGQTIEAGDKVEWNRGEKARHLSCQPATKVTVESLLARMANMPAAGNPEWAELARQVDELEAAAVAKPVAIARFAVEDAGVYVLPNGTIVKIKANKAGTSTYPERWIEQPPARLNENDDRVHGEYTYEDDYSARKALMNAVVSTGRKMTLDEAKAFILRYGQCARCSRKLKAAKSVEAGIGPVCIRYFASGTTAAALMVGAASGKGQPDTKGSSTVATVSRWSRPGDDELESAGYAF